MKIIVKDGVNEDAKYTQVARDIADYVVKELKLDFGNVEFRLVSNDEFAAGIALSTSPLPTWYTGQEYITTRENMDARSFNLYEMVSHKYLNTLENEEYTVVYLNKSDTEAELRSVIAHVYGHMHMDYNNYVCKGYSADLIKNSVYRERYTELEKILGEKNLREGQKKAEAIFDNGQTLSTLIDMFPETRTKELDEIKGYYKTDGTLPEKREHDVFRFLIDNSNLHPWEKEIYEMMYDNSQHMRFMRVKVMHEGFASWVEEKYALYGEKDPVMSAKIQLAIESVANPKNPSQMPYALGLRLFKNIEERGNKGRFGFKYEILPDDQKLEYDDKSGKGIEKILDVVRFTDDLQFIQSFADNNFLEKYLAILKDFPEDYEPQTFEEMQYYERIMQMTPRDLKIQLIFEREQMLPRISIPPGGSKFQNRGLLLEHDSSFIDKYLQDGYITTEDLPYVWENLTLVNQDTGKSLVRISKVYGKTIFLKTFDPEGRPCYVVADTNGAKVILLKEESKGVSMFG